MAAPSRPVLSLLSSLCCVVAVLAGAGPVAARVVPPEETDLATSLPRPQGGELAPRATPSGSTSRGPGVWPLHPRPVVVEHFDPPLVSWGAGHRGVDLAGHAGQRVRASLAGRVSFTGRVAGRPVVVVDHGATRTTYQPVLASVRRGQRVDAGDVVGRLVATGSHCPARACLHWGLRRGETYLDPLTLVDAPRPVRLWPW